MQPFEHWEDMRAGAEADDGCGGATNYEERMSRTTSDYTTDNALLACPTD